MLLRSYPAAMGGAAAARRALFTSLSASSLLSTTLFSTARSRHGLRLLSLSRRTRCLSTATVLAAEESAEAPPLRQSLLLERLRLRHLKEAARSPQRPPPTAAERRKKKEEGEKSVAVASSFDELGLCEEVMGAVRETGISTPTEIQCIGVPAVLQGKSVVLGSHTGSGKTLAYMLPLVQLLRHDEELSGKLMKPKRPRAVVLCPTRELCEQVFRVAKSISHHARFRSTMISGGVRLRPQEDSLSVPVDMVVGTPGRILQHIEEGNLVYGGIKYLVLDEADTMFDRGFGPDIRKFLAPLKNRVAKHDDQGFQTVLVTATMTQAVQTLVDEEFQGIIHLRTSSLHKKIATARHDFIKLSGSENKLESLLQVLEPSLAKGNRVMVFCNTLNSSRAVDHFLGENQIYTVNYHGEVPAEERVENLKKFKSEDGDCPTLVCTDLAARGLDLDVDHVVMFDFPSNAIDYLHRTGRTARMGAKGKVTSLVAKRDVLLATRIEEAITKNESLEALNAGSVRRDVEKSGQNDQKGKSSSFIKAAKQKTKLGGKSLSIVKAGKQNAKLGVTSWKSSRVGRKAAQVSAQKPRATKSFSPVRTRKSVSLSKPVKSPANSLNRESSKGRKRLESRKSDVARSKSPANSLNRESSKGKKRLESRKSDVARSKLSVVGFRGRSSSGRKESLRQR